MRARCCFDLSVVAFLPRREAEVLSSLRQGLAEKQIARRLGISQHTVHVYIKRLYAHYDVCSRTELLAIWASESAWGQRSGDLDSPRCHRAPKTSQL